MTALLRVVSAELFKILHKRRGYVLAGLWWLLLPTVALVVARVLQVNFAGSFVDAPGTGVAEIVQGFASPHGLARVGLTGPAFLSPTFYIIVAALLAALFIGEERSLNMWKTTLVAQPSRLAVLWGKIVAIMIVLAILMAGAFVSSAIAGAIGMIFLPTTFAGDWGSLAGLYVLQWAFLLAAVLFAALLIFLVRNIALGLVATFFVPALLEGLYTVWQATVGFEPLNRLNAPFQVLRLRQTLEDLPQYFFTNNLYLPARIPARSLIDVFSAGLQEEAPPADMAGTPFANLFGGSLTLPHSAAVMAGYAILFALVLTFLFVRRDVD